MLFVVCAIINTSISLDHIDIDIEGCRSGDKAGDNGGSINRGSDSSSGSESKGSSDNNDNKNTDQGTSDNGQQQQGETGSNEEGSSNTGPDNNLQTTTGGEGEQGGTGPVTPQPGPIDCSTSPNDPSCTVGCPRDPATGECIAHIDCAPRPGFTLVSIQNGKCMYKKNSNDITSNTGSSGGSGSGGNTAIAISIVNVVNQIKNIFRSHTTVNNIVPTQVPQLYFLRNMTVPLHLCNGMTPGPCYDIVHQSVIIP